MTEQKELLITPIKLLDPDYLSNIKSVNHLIIRGHVKNISTILRRAVDWGVTKLTIAEAENWFLPLELKLTSLIIHGRCIHWRWFSVTKLAKYIRTSTTLQTFEIREPGKDRKRVLKIVRAVAENDNLKRVALFTGMAASLFSGVVDLILVSKSITDLNLSNNKCHLIEPIRRLIIEGKFEHLKLKVIPAINNYPYALVSSLLLNKSLITLNIGNVSNIKYKCYLDLKEVFQRHQSLKEIGPYFSADDKTVDKTEPLEIINPDSDQLV